MDRGYILVNTGEGKGKTTAAIGLAIRSTGAGFKVYIGQFLKKGDYSEIKILKKLENITVEQYGTDRFIGQTPRDIDIKKAQEGLKSLEKAMISGLYDLVIADEINVAVKLGLLKEDQILSLMDKKPKTVELVLTGRYAKDSVIDKADVVTEMHCIKHHFQKGVKAREGIER